MEKRNKDFTFKRRKTQKGFTLIELLVVMAILGFLAVISFGAFRNSQIKARDAQRKHDLSQISKALEMYNNDKAVYPLTGELPDGGDLWQDEDEADGVIYIKSMPYDPGGANYCYESADGDSFQIYAILENERDQSIEKTCGAGGGECSCGGAANADDYNYRATSLNQP